ncbi:MAG: hypothetical protein ACE5EH_13200, partial [Gammaproteobacteria bacterium]
MSSPQAIALSQLTDKQRFWYEHLERARASETSLAAYARAQDLQVKALYHYQSVLRQKGIVKTATRFTRVTHASIVEHRSANDAVILYLRNGHRVELPVETVDLHC